MVRSEFAVGHHSVSSAYCLSIHLGVAQQAERVEYLVQARVDERGGHFQRTDTAASDSRIPQSKRARRRLYE